MSGPNRGVGRFRRLYVNPETTFGTDPDGYPVAADAVRIVSASVSVAKPSGPRPDANGTGGPDGSIPEKGTVEWQIDLVLTASGAAGTAPDWDDLLVYVGGMTKTTGGGTSVSGSGSTTTVVDVADASGESVGGCVTISGETRFVTAVDTASTPDNITITPALSSAPGDSTTVDDGLAWSYNADSDDTGATLWFCNNAHQIRVQGAFATSITLSFGGDGAARLSMSGRGVSADFRYTGALNGSINNSTTSVVVDNDDIVPDDVSASNPYYFTIAKGGASEEHIRVTAKSSNTLTVVRGVLSSSAASQDDNATIEPYQPAPTYSGSPVPATGGHAYLGGVLAQVETASWEADRGREGIENAHGDAWSVSNFDNGSRTTNVQFAGWSTNDDLGPVVRDAYQQTYTEAFVQQGSTTGGIVGATSPRVYFQIPENGFNDQATRWTLAGPAHMQSATGNDEFRICHG